MATLYVCEYSSLGLGAQTIAAEPPITEQTVAIGAAAQSNTFNTATRYVRLHADSICSVQFGVSPSATVAVTNKRMAAGQTEYFAVPPGYRVGVISNT